jgi:peptidoglycan hydrolase CwlO-like protein
MAKTSATPNREILEAALQGLEAQRQKLEEQISQVRGMMGQRTAARPAKGSAAESSSQAASSSSRQRKRRVLSPEARKRIAAAQKKRWASFRKNQG